MKNKEKYYNNILKTLTTENDTTCKFKRKYVLKVDVCTGISCVDCCQRTKEWLEQEYHEPITLTDDEKVILKNIDKLWKWLAKDKNDLLFLHEEKPYKVNDTMWDNDGWRYKLDIFNHLFTFIKWEDEPYNIDELLK